MSESSCVGVLDDLQSIYVAQEGITEDGIESIEGARVETEILVCVVTEGRIRLLPRAISDDSVGDHGEIKGVNWERLAAGSR